MPTDAERARRWNTPSSGPWEWVHYEGEGITLYDPSGVPVIDTHERGITDGNARLIAATPDLLAALEALLQEALSMDGQIHGEWGQGPWPGGDDVPAIVNARAAIAKATGEAQVP